MNPTQNTAGLGRFVLIGVTTMLFAMGAIAAAWGGLGVASDSRAHAHACGENIDLSVVTPATATNFDNPRLVRLDLPLGGYACEFMLRDGSVYRAPSSWDSTFRLGVGVLSMGAGLGLGITALVRARSGSALGPGLVGPSVGLGHPNADTERG